MHKYTSQSKTIETDCVKFWQCFNMRLKILLIAILCVRAGASGDTEEDFDITITFEKWAWTYSKEIGRVTVINNFQDAK